MMLINYVNHGIDDLPGVAEGHHRIRLVEKIVVQAGIAGGHPPLINDDTLGFVGFQNRHAADWRLRVFSFAAALITSFAAGASISISTTPAWPNSHLMSSISAT
jgi:hypothetical protein